MNQKHYKKLIEGVNAFKEWREVSVSGPKSNPVWPDLTGADLSDVNLSGASLCEANLLVANLTRADLTGAQGFCKVRDSRPQ